MRASELIDERPQLVGRQRPVHPTPAFGQLGVDVTAAEHHFQGAGAADQPGEANGAGPARQDAEGDLRLAEDRLPEGCEPEVTRKRQLTAAAPDATFDHRDRRLRHRPEALAHAVEGVELGRWRQVGRDLQDQPHVEVGDEELRVRAAQDDDPGLVVGGELVGELRHLEVERQVEEVDRRVVDRDRGDTAVERHPQGRGVSYAMPRDARAPGVAEQRPLARPQGAERRWGASEASVGAQPRRSQARATRSSRSSVQ